MRDAHHRKDKNKKLIISHNQAKYKLLTTKKQRNLQEIACHLVKWKFLETQIQAALCLFKNLLALILGLAAIKGKINP